MFWLGVLGIVYYQSPRIERTSEKTAMAHHKMRDTNTEPLSAEIRIRTGDRQIVQRDFMDIPLPSDETDIRRTKFRARRLHYLLKSDLCELVCSHCQQKLPLRWSALCKAQCSNLGHAYQLCFAMWRRDNLIEH